MSTSNTYTWTSTRDQIISNAFRKINALGDYETLTGDNRLTAGINAINPVIKNLMAKGMPVWAITETTVAFSNFSTALPVSIGIGQTINSVAPLKVIQALRKDDLTGIDVPMNIYTYEDYEILSNKTATGAPVHIFYQPLRNTGNIKVWPLPDTGYWQVNGSLYMRYHRPYQDMTASTDELDFPVEWHLPVTYALAYSLAPEYGVDMGNRQQLFNDMQYYINEALSFGTEEGSIYLQPRYR